MINFFRKPNEKISKLLGVDHETVLYRLLPHFLMDIMKRYFRLETEGSEHIPLTGPALFTPNHSGYSGFDAMILSHEIYSSSKRVPRVLTHHLWFLTKATAIPAQKMGFIEATTENGLLYLSRKNLVVLFPEGENGNFKSTTQKYKLQEFRRGFVRMALKTQSPIIPTLIIGAEETHINLKTLKFSKYLKGLVLPLPLNLLPLPVKWKIKFLPPIHLPYAPEAADDTELVHELAMDIQEQMQRSLNTELEKRSLF